MHPDTETQPSSPAEEHKGSQSQSGLEIVPPGTLSLLWVELGSFIGHQDYPVVFLPTITFAGDVVFQTIRVPANLSWDRPDFMDPLLKSQKVLAASTAHRD